MAWLYKRGQRWWIGYRVGNQQFLKPTGETDQDEAEKHLNRFEAMERVNRSGNLTESFYLSLTGVELTKITVKAALNEWLADCKGTTARNTHARYEDVAQQFLAYLKANDKAPALREITTDHIRGFLNASHKHLSASSVNLSRKILSTFFNRELIAKRVADNPVKGTKRFKAEKHSRVDRRAFTIQELPVIMRKAPSDFWRYMVTGGPYTGLRMGDLICLKASEIALGENLLRLENIKTGETVNIPMARPFRALIEKRIKQRGRLKPNDFLWPDEAARYLKNGSGAFSNEFYDDVLQPAGLVAKRSSKKAQKNGRAVSRQLNDVSFHSFRHTFVSLLKASGASQAVAKELAGHTNDSISDLYTDVDPELMRKAIALLPEVAA